MSIICDLEQGGKITEEEAFKQIKDLGVDKISPKTAKFKKLIQ